MLRSHFQAAVWLGMLLFLSCGNPDTAPSQPPTAPAPSEEELVMRLSESLSSEDSPLARERNALINYAIDHLWDIQVHPKGFYYQVLSPGEGKPIEWGQELNAHYRTYNLDGQVIDESYRRQKPMRFQVGSMIPAWNEALQLVKPGAQLRLLCPSDLAYGAEGLVAPSGDTIIRPHTTLLFDITLLP